MTGYSQRKTAYVDMYQVSTVSVRCTCNWIWPDFWSLDRPSKGLRMTVATHFTHKQHGAMAELHHGVTMSRCWSRVHRPIIFTHQHHEQDILHLTCKTTAHSTPPVGGFTYLIQFSPSPLVNKQGEDEGLQRLYQSFLFQEDTCTRTNTLLRWYGNFF